jgi:hypothetical protein
LGRGEREMTYLCSIPEYISYFRICNHIYIPKHRKDM